jgi:hypothetical protein
VGWKPSAYGYSEEVGSFIFPNYEYPEWKKPQYRLDVSSENQTFSLSWKDKDDIPYYIIEETKNPNKFNRGTKEPYLSYIQWKQYESPVSLESSEWVLGKCETSEDAGKDSSFSGYLAPKLNQTLFENLAQIN